MNEQEFEDWRINVKKVFYAQILLDDLKKEGKINKKQEKKIRERIKKKRYSNLLSSPHLEGKLKLKQNVLVRCVKDYCSFMGTTIKTTLT